MMEQSLLIMVNVRLANIMKLVKMDFNVLHVLLDNNQTLPILNVLHAPMDLLHQKGLVNVNNVEMIRQ